MSPYYSDEPSANKRVSVVASGDTTARNPTNVQQVTPVQSVVASTSTSQLPANHKPYADELRRFKRDSDAQDSDDDGVWVDDDDEDDDDSRQTIAPQSSNVVESSADDEDEDSEGSEQPETAADYATRRGSGAQRTGPSSYELAPDDFVVYAGK